MLNVLASQKDKKQRQIRSFINGLFISLLELLSLLCSLSTNSKTLQLPCTFLYVLVCILLINSIEKKFT